MTDVATSGLDPDLVLRALESAGHVFPHEAMRWSLDNWDEVAPALLARLRDYADGTDRSEPTQAALLFIIHLVGEVSERSAFEPLTRICRDGAEMDVLIGDGVTETLSRILVGTYDGRIATLQAVIEDPRADEFVRDAALEAYSYLAASERIPLEDARAYLGGLYGTLRPQATSHVWVGWQEAVARLGCSDLKDSVAEAFRRNFIDPSVMDHADFEGDLDAALRAATPLEAFADSSVGRSDSLVEELSNWHDFSEEYRRELKRAAKRDDDEDGDRRGPDTGLPYVNPDRHVGRNDPCPCGSGRKFKKCCLAA